MNNRQAFGQPIIILLSLILLYGCKKTEVPPTEPVEIARTEYIRFHEGVCSGDLAERADAFDRITPTKSQLATLFGDENAESAFSLVRETVKKAKNNSAKTKAEFERSGKLVSVEVTDVRTEPKKRWRTDLLDTIPSDIPIYEIQIRYENGGGHMSGLLILDGQLKIIKGLYGLPEELN